MKLKPTDGLTIKFRHHDDGMCRVELGLADRNVHLVVEVPKGQDPAGDWLQSASDALEGAVQNKPVAYTPPWGGGGGRRNKEKPEAPNPPPSSA